ncbi:hypothetical protein H3L94_07000 [Neisseria shayeganii]|uniref:Uncharacterized protein n=2 Tax=Neisseria shayeganii TaxID=607712 RepID=A0A7D7RTX2_9NEIS|nr:hypothetical protein H3L94_07000 [Neisseria shayeganii]
MMRDPEFFLHRYAPTTNIMAFLEVPYDKLVDSIAQWERKRDKYREVPAQKIDIDGTWGQRLNSLLPLDRSKVMISETQSQWCVYVDNSRQGTDLNSDPYFLYKELGVREISVVMVRDIPKVKPGSTQFMYGDGTQATKIVSETGWHYEAPGRYIAAHRENRWEFEEWGDPFPFEEVEQYQAQRIKDRLTPAMVERYCSHFGIDLFNPDFYSGRACIFKTQMHPDSPKLLQFPNQQT